MYFLTGPRGQVLAIEAEETPYCRNLVDHCLKHGWMVEYVAPYRF